MRHPHTIETAESVRIAAERMSEGGFPALAVTNEGRVIGLLSNRDLVAKVIARSLSSDDTQVSEVMDSDPVRISDDRDVPSALLVMQVREVHALLVQDFTGKVVGIFCDCGCCHMERNG